MFLRQRIHIGIDEMNAVDQPGSMSIYGLMKYTILELKANQAKLRKPSTDFPVMPTQKN